MLLRRQRKHLHGASNRDQSHFNTASFSATTTLFPIKSVKTAIKNEICSSSHLKKRYMQYKDSSIHKANNDIEDSNQSAHLFQVKKKLKAIYRGRKNIIKSIDGWGYDSRGWISRQQFKSKVKGKIAQDLTQEQVDQLFLHFGANKQKLDVKSLLGIIHEVSQGMVFNQTLFIPTSNNKDRQKLISNLKQNIKGCQKLEKRDLTDTVINQLLSKINTSVSRMKHKNEENIPEKKQTFFKNIVKFANFSQYQQQLLNNVQQAVNYSQLYKLIQSHKNIDNIFTDSILRKTKPRKYLSEVATDQSVQISQPFSNKMMKSASNFLKTQNFQNKKTFLDPFTFLGVNQQKTRFGRSKFTKQSSDWFTGHYNLAQTPNKRQSALQAIRSQQDIHKIRQQNKLQKLRTLRQKQQQNISIKQQLAVSRDQKRLQRIRNQQEAYNYVNFIKKRWE